METSRTVTSITVNGRTYSSIDQMSPDVRAEYEQAMSLLADKNNNGVPDVLEGSLPRDGSATTVKTVVEKVVTHTTDLSTDFDLRRLSSASGTTSRSWSSDGGGIAISWSTLLALLATVALVAAAIMWYSK